MKIDIVDNKIVYLTALPDFAEAFFENRRSVLMSCNTFQMLADSYESIEEFINGIRLASSYKLMFQGVEIGLIRNGSIYLGNEADIEVNLDIIDAIIAARVYLPGGKYGILGKIDALRNNTQMYYNKKISVNVMSCSFAYEKNQETGEECYMSKGTIEIFDEELVKIILNDPKTKILSPKI